MDSMAWKLIIPLRGAIAPHAPNSAAKRRTAV
ncbi:hypothetical protein HD596_003482 [Nonomuraea jabiensis]|uniref:Uncharacterized protein n=1 Tax=Nonomuraea jabiensis TaxID=882448 RepID=A0A7W9LAK7_9ACTN|nr:hypothetical protein [Nonomuraea jabiensis]